MEGELEVSWTIMVDNGALIVLEICVSVKKRGRESGKATKGFAVLDLSPSAQQRDWPTTTVVSALMTTFRQRSKCCRIAELSHR